MVASEETTVCDVTTSTRARSVGERPLDGAGKLLRLLHPLSVSSEGPRHRGIVGMSEQRADHPTAIVCLLVEALDVPRRVVGYYHYVLCAVADRRVDLHRVESESAVARDAHHLPAGIGERGRDGVGRSNAKAAEGAGVHISARLEAYAGEAEEVAAVGDGDVVRPGLLTKSLKDGAWIDGAVRSCRVAWSGFGVAVTMPLLQPFRPGPVDGRLAVASRGHDRRRARGRALLRFPVRHGDCR